MNVTTAIEIRHASRRLTRHMTEAEINTPFSLAVFSPSAFNIHNSFK